MGFALPVAEHSRPGLAGDSHTRRRLVMTGEWARLDRPTTAPDREEGESGSTGAPKTAARLISA